MARAFNGSSDGFRSSSGAGIDGLAAFTFACKARHSSGTYMICAPQDVTGSNGFDIRHDGTGFRAGLVTDATSYQETGAVATDGNYHHWAARWDSAGTDQVLRLYKDGVESATVGPLALGSNVKADPDEIDFGIFGTFGARWAGDLAECALWDIALTVAEIEALSKGFSPAIIRPNRLLRYWKGFADFREEKGLGGTLTGTTAAAHPPMIYAGRSRSRVAPAAVQRRWILGTH